MFRLILTLGIIATFAILGLKTMANEDEDLIKSLREASNQAIKDHNLEAVNSFIDEDYVITISSGLIERSKEEHTVSFKAHFNNFPDVVYIRTPSEVNVSASHPLAFETGNWVGTRKGLEIGGQYSAQWRKVEGYWKIHSELFTALYCTGPNC
ncbi:MAG: nuclear transport factor 2 family protein [Sphingomonadales bacterium]|jgi:ketosteroid isomerase-like protein